MTLRYLLLIFSLFLNNSVLYCSEAAQEDLFEILSSLNGSPVSPSAPSDTNLFQKTLHAQALEKKIKEEEQEPRIKKMQDKLCRLSKNDLKNYIKNQKKALNFWYYSMLFVHDIKADPKTGEVDRSTIDLQTLKPYHAITNDYNQKKDALESPILKKLIDEEITRRNEGKSSCIIL